MKLPANNAPAYLSDSNFAVTDEDGDALEHIRYCPRSKTRDDQREGFACNEPLIAAKLSAFGLPQHYDFSGLKTATSPTGNQFLWNAKRLDPQLGWYVYHYRHYSPELGRWPSRDPIEEDGGVNLYGFVGNGPISSLDFFGLSPSDEMIYRNNHGPQPQQPKPEKLDDGHFSTADLKDAVDATLQDIEQKFKNTDRRNQFLLCCAIKNLASIASQMLLDSDFWDIDHLKSPTGLPDRQRGSFPGRFGPAKSYRVVDLVTFDGAVYWGYSVNWVMWGKINSLCQELKKETGSLTGNFSLTHARLVAGGYKIIQGFGKHEERPVDADGTLAFTTYGYTGQMPQKRRFVVPRPDGRFRNIEARAERVPRKIMPWEWRNWHDGVGLSGG